MMLLALGMSSAQAQRANVGAVEAPLGKENVVWYTTWDTAVAEAKRSNRPIFFMGAAAQCGNVSGTF